MIRSLSYSSILQKRTLFLFNLTIDKYNLQQKTYNTQNQLMNLRYFLDQIVQDKELEDFLQLDVQSIINKFFLKIFEFKFYLLDTIVLHKSNEVHKMLIIPYIMHFHYLNQVQLMDQYYHD